MGTNPCGLVWSKGKGVKDLTTSLSLLQLSSYLTLGQGLTGPNIPNNLQLDQDSLVGRTGGSRPLSTGCSLSPNKVTAYRVPFLADKLSCCRACRTFLAARLAQGGNRKLLEPGLAAHAELVACAAGNDPPSFLELKLFLMKWAPACD